MIKPKKRRWRRNRYKKHDDLPRRHEFNSDNEYVVAYGKAWRAKKKKED